MRNGRSSNKELNEAIAADKDLRVYATCCGRVRATPNETAELRAAAEAEQARAETSGQKVELLHGFLQLTDYAQAVWEDRLWATEPHSLKQLRAKRRHYEQTVKGLRQWKGLMEQSLSAVSDQILRQILRAEDESLRRRNALAQGAFMQLCRSGRHWICVRSARLSSLRI